MKELTEILREVRLLHEKLDKLLSTKDEKNSRFTPPTLEEVADYFIERMPNADTEDAINFADVFISHYTNTNWYYGKKKMKDWKAAMRSAWKLHEFITNKNKTNDTVGRIQRTELQEWVNS
jgi:hypothetical protein